MTVFALRRTVLALASLSLSTIACDASPDIERRVADLLGRMTLSEKVGQLNLVSNDPPYQPEALTDELAAGQIGGVMNFHGAGPVGRVQRLARRSRLGIPLLFGTDVLHGYRTMFPVPLGEAASFDPDLARLAATEAAREAVVAGVNWTFAPVADLARDPRWGRIVEGSGEDPFLARVFTKARVAGFRAGGLATSLKHFAGYGAAIGGRDYDATAIPTADLVDSYLPPFRAGIEAGAESVMSAFNALNGVPATASRFLLTDVLRGRWGYDGFVTSDWSAVDELRAHGIARDGAEAARKALAAGVDMDMASRLYVTHLPGEVAAGRVPEAAIDEAASRVLRAKIRMGLFERPDLDPAAPDDVPPSAATRAAARRVAADTFVLLRNAGALPLSGRQRIAVIGGMAANGQDLTGPHGAQVRFDDAVTVLAGLRARAERDGATVTHAAGCPAECEDDSGFAAAVAEARSADVVVAVLGEPQEITGEAASRARLTLPGRQAELLERLVGTGRPVVLVLLASRPVELGPVLDRLAALVMAWFPGTEGGSALADSLFGDVPPSAKLPISWPRTVGQLPLVYDRLPSGRPTRADNRFTLRYADEAVTPLFPFGFGLTYTDFSYSDLAVGAARVPADGSLSVSVRLTNAGTRPGREVAQLYVRQLVASVSRPVRQLKAFEKVALAPGEARTLTFTVPASELGFHRDDGSYVVEPGPFEVYVGSSSDATLSAPFAVE